MYVILIISIVIFLVLVGNLVLLHCLQFLYCLPCVILQQVSYTVINKEYFILSYLVLSYNVILQGCDLERSRSSMKVKKFFVSPPLPNHNYTREVSWKSYCQFVYYGKAIVD